MDWAVFMVFSAILGYGKKDGIFDFGFLWRVWIRIWVGIMG